MARRRIEGCRAIVTGASSGIGEALALELAQAGARLILVARREEALQQLADRIAKVGQQAQVVAGDVTDSATRRAALDRAQQTWGGLDLLVNNAGISAHGRFAQASPERLRQIMEVNFFAAAEFIREALPLLEKGRDPLVVNIGSIIGHRGIPRNSEYCASKFALQGLSEAIRPELVRVGVDLLVVSPGPTETTFFDNLLERDHELAWADRKGKAPEQVARQAVAAIRRGRSEIIPSRRGRMLVWLNRLAPRLVDRIMRRYG